MPIRPMSPRELATAATVDVPAPQLPPVRQRVRPAAPPTPGPTAGAAPSVTEDRADYAVGYGKPPQHTRFQSGKSGNPRGRPKAAKGLKTIVRETMIAKVAVRTANGEKKMSRMEAVLHKTVELGMKGNSRALAQLISLYASAVPEAALPLAAALPEEELSATDLAMLEELKASWLASQGDDQ